MLEAATHRARKFISGRKMHIIQMIVVRLLRHPRKYY